MKGTDYNIYLNLKEAQVALEEATQFYRAGTFDREVLSDTGRLMELKDISKYTVDKILAVETAIDQRMKILEQEEK